MSIYFESGMPRHSFLFCFVSFFAVVFVLAFTLLGVLGLPGAMVWGLTLIGGEFSVITAQTFLLLHLSRLCVRYPFAFVSQTVGILLCSCQSLPSWLFQCRGVQ